MRPADSIAHLDPRFAPATRLLWQYGVLGALERIAGLGFSAAEIWAQHLEASKVSAQEAKARADRLGLRLSLHAPAYDLNPLSSNREIAAVSQRQVLECLEDAARLAAVMVVVHPGAISSSTDDPEEYWLRLEEFAGLLNEKAASLGQRIAFEGMERKRLQFVTDLEALDRLSEMLEANGLAQIGLTLDIAHAATLGDPMEYVVRAPRLIHAHLSDTSEHKTHALLGEGRLALDGIIPVLLERLPEGLIAIEGRLAADELRAVSTAAAFLRAY